MANKIIDTNTLLYYHQAIKSLLANKVDKEIGKSLLSDTEINRLVTLKNYDDTEIKNIIETMQKQIQKLESGTYDDTQLRHDIAETYATIASLSNVAISGSYNDLKDTPTSMPASDVSDWAKASTKPIYTATEVGADIEGAASNALTSAKSYTDALETKINAKLTSAMHYKGSVNTYADLPLKPEIGDFYNIINEGENNRQGDNAAWTGTEWDITSGMIDLSSYICTKDIALNADIDTILQS